MNFHSAMSEISVFYNEILNLFRVSQWCSQGLPKSSHPPERPNEEENEKKERKKKEKWEKLQENEE